MIISVYKTGSYIVQLTRARPFASLSPGDLVRHVLWPESLGIIVCVASDQVGVMWSRTNETTRELDKELDTIRRGL